MCISLYIYIYIYTYTYLHIYRKEPVRFDLFRFRNFLNIIVSIRFGLAMSVERLRRVAKALLVYFFHETMSLYQEGTGSVRFGSGLFENASLRFGSVRFRVLFRPVPKLNGSIRFDSVRFGRFGSVSYSYLYLLM